MRRRFSDDEEERQQMDGFWDSGQDGVNIAADHFFGVTIILICFVGQEPPGLLTLWRSSTRKCLQ